MKLSSVTVTFSYDGEPTVNISVHEERHNEFREAKSVTFDHSRIEAIKGVMSRLWREVQAHRI